MKIQQDLRQRVLYLLNRHSSFTKYIFSFYYSSLYYSFITKAINAKTTLRNEIENTINGYESNDVFNSKDSDHLLDEGAGAETASYVQATRSVIANLEKDFALPAYKPPLKIMPLGDSITYGVMGVNARDSGGYRTELWKKFVANGLKVEFVGSQSSGPDSLSNKNHEGHLGWTIKQIASSVDQWLTTYQPDIVLLMVGTNDTKQHSLKTMFEDLSALIDQITAYSPNTQLLVASIPPIHPVAKSVMRSLRATYFNTAIPVIVNSRITQGKKVVFVDMRSLTVNDLSSSLSLDLDNGLHPNAQGYRKIANFWHDAVFKVISQRQSSTTSVS